MLPIHKCIELAGHYRAPIARQDEIIIGRYVKFKSVFLVTIFLLLEPSARAVVVGHWPLAIGRKWITHSRCRRDTPWCPTVATDRCSLPGGSLAFNAVDQQHVEIPGGGLDGLAAGKISMWMKWKGIQSRDCYRRTPTFGPVLVGKQMTCFPLTPLPFLLRTQTRLWPFGGNPVGPLIF